MCREAGGIKRTPIGQTASAGNDKNYYESVESVIAYVEYEKRAPACFSQCERVCKRKSSCSAFSSWIKKDLSDATCYCYGWGIKPDFKDWGDDRYQSGWCVTGWFETGTM